MTQEEIKKLAEWAGFKYQEEDGSHYRGWVYIDSLNQSQRYISELNFPESLTACFKWLVPKLKDNYLITLQSIPIEGERNEQWWCGITPCGSLFLGVKVWAETPALALCKAILKLVEAEE